MVTGPNTGHLMQNTVEEHYYFPEFSVELRRLELKFHLIIEKLGNLFPD